MRRLLSNIALALGSLALITPMAAVQTAAAAANQPDRYCYNWDFVNNTPQDANDLHIRLKGITTIGHVYTGALNPFGVPGPGSGYDSANNAYNLDFVGGPVNTGEIAHIGLCTDNPVLALSNQGSGLPPFYWTVDGSILPNNPLFAGLSWQWTGRQSVRLSVLNSQNVTLTLLSLNVLDADTPLELDDLNHDVAAQLPLVRILAEDPLDLPPMRMSFFDVFFGESATDATTIGSLALNASDQAQLAPPNHPYVVEAVLEDASDPGNTVRMYSQALAPPAAVYLPIAVR